MKRATGITVDAEPPKEISIHALVKRATTAIMADRCLQTISIHALVKRATRLQDFLNLVTLNFNPRPREEGDEEIKQIKYDDVIFQSTPS